MTDKHEPDRYRWSAMQPPEVAQLFQRYPGRWWSARGWSLDLFLAHPHAALPGGELGAWHVRDEKPALQSFLSGKTLPRQARDSWCRPVATEAWQFQAMIMHAEGPAAGRLVHR